MFNFQQKMNNKISEISNSLVEILVDQENMQSKIENYKINEINPNAKDGNKEKNLQKTNL